MPIKIALVAILLAGCVAERVETLKCKATCEDCKKSEFECEIVVEDDIDIIRKDMPDGK